MEKRNKGEGLKRSPHICVMIIIFLIFKLATVLLTMKNFLLKHWGSSVWPDLHVFFSNLMYFVYNDKYFIQSVDCRCWFKTGSLQNVNSHL